MSSGLHAEGPRVGVIGVGSLGYHHARILTGLDGVRMEGVFDVDPERGARAERELGVTSYDSAAALLDRVDAVVVAVPTESHEAVAIEALDGGAHVLIEKPMAPDLAAADRILERAEHSGRMVQIGHVERFNPALLAARPYLDRPLFIESHRMAPFTARSTDVAVVLDLMIHDVDLVQGLIDSPVAEIAASGVPVLTANADIASARLTFENGAVANLTASRISVERMRKLRVFQRSGYLSLDLAEGRGQFLRLREGLPALSSSNGGSRRGGTSGAAGEPVGERVGEPVAVPGLGDLVERIPLEGDAVEPLRRELEAFRDAVLGEREPAVSGVEGRAALAVTLSIQDRIEGHVSDSRAAQS